jgi:hypothetical protein
MYPGLLANVVWISSHENSSDLDLSFNLRSLMESTGASKGLYENEDGEDGMVGC